LLEHAGVAIAVRPVDPGVRSLTLGGAGRSWTAGAVSAPQLPGVVLNTRWTELEVTEAR
jgi:hypothetical protein